MASNTGSGNGRVQISPRASDGYAGPGLRARLVVIHYLAFAALEWLVIAGAMWLGTLSFWLWPLAIVIIGTRQHAIAVLGHDGAHFTISKNRRLNDALMALTFWPLAVGVHGYRKFHFEHHRHVGTPADPELRAKRMYPHRWTVEALAPRRRAQMLLVDLAGGGWRDVLMIFVLAKPRTVADWVGPPLTVAALVGCLLWLGQWQAVAMWFIAIHTVFWAGFRQRCLEEHVGPEVTRQRIKVPALWQRLLYLPHGIWKHAEHHRRPAVHPMEL